MKKYYLVVFCALLLFVVVGCSKKNQVVCTASTTEQGITMDAEVIGDLDADNKITAVTVVYDLHDKKYADQYCSMFKLFETEGSGVKVNCSGSKITIEGMASMDIDAEEDEKIIGKTKEEFIAAAQESEDIKFTCK